MLVRQKQKYYIPTWTDGLIRGYHGLHPYTGSVLFFTWELWRCMWDQDNYLLAGLHDLTPAPGSDTELPTFQSADPAFHQLLQHNDIADVGKCWCLLPIVLPSGGVFGYYNQHRLVVSQSGLAHPVWSHKNNITKGRWGAREARTTHQLLISVC